MEEKRVTGWTGWVAFASIAMMFVGVVQAVYGFAALFNQNWYVATDSSIYLFDIGTWGWSMLALGALVFVSGALLMAGNAFGRTMGVLFAAVGIIVNLVWLAATPVWSILGLVLYSLVLYAIIAHGGEMKELSKA